MALTHIRAGSTPATPVVYLYSFLESPPKPTSGMLIKEPSQGSVGFAEFADSVQAYDGVAEHPAQSLQT